MIQEAQHIYGSRSPDPLNELKPTFAQFEHQIHMFPLIKIANQLHLGRILAGYEYGDTTVIHIIYSCVYMIVGICWEYEYECIL